MADQENLQEPDNSYQNPHAQQQNMMNASQLGGMDPNYMMQQQDPAMYAQGYEQGMIDPNQHDIMMNNTMMSENYDPMDNFPLEALAPFNQGLAAFASEDIDQQRGQRLKEARLMEALERQTSLLDSIAQSYQKNKEMRHKADLRKLKNRLETLENQKLFRELEYQQMQAANDIAQQNNQLIFSHLNAQAQLKANPIVLNMAQGSLPPFLLPPTINSLPSLNHMGYSLPPLGFPGSVPPRPLPFGPGPPPPWGQPGPRPMIRHPLLGPIPAGPRSGPLPGPLSLPLNIPPMGQLRLPPIQSTRRDKKSNRKNSDSDDDDDRRAKSSRKTTKVKKADVDKYLGKVFDKYKKS